MEHCFLKRDDINWSKEPFKCEIRKIYDHIWWGEWSRKSFKLNHMLWHERRTLGWYFSRGLKILEHLRTIHWEFKASLSWKTKENFKFNIKTYKTWGLKRWWLSTSSFPSCRMCSLLWLKRSVFRKFRAKFYKDWSSWYLQSSWYWMGEAQ